MSDGSGAIKAGAACCLAMAIATTSTYGALYLGLSQQADAYDIANEPATYDMCGFGTDESGVEFNTKWSMVFRFQAVFYLLITSMLGMGCLGLVIPPCVFCTCCATCGTMCIQMAALITAGIMRFRSTGDKCSAVDIAYNADGDSFASDGETYKALFIAQCAMAVPLGCFLMCALQMSGFSAVNKEGGFERQMSWRYERNF